MHSKKIGYIKIFENGFKQEMTVKGGKMCLTVTCEKELAFISGSCMHFLLGEIWR